MPGQASTAKLFEYSFKYLNNLMAAVIITKQKSSRSARQRAEELVRPLKREDSSESAQLELLGGSQSITDYSSHTTTTSSMDDPEAGHGGARLGGYSQYSRARTHKPDKGLFDDV